VVTCWSLAAHLDSITAGCVLLVAGHSQAAVMSQQLLYRWWAVCSLLPPTQQRCVPWPRDPNCPKLQPACCLTLLRKRSTAVLLRPAASTAASSAVADVHTVAAHKHS